MLHLSEWLWSKTQVTAHAGEDVESGEHSSPAGGGANLSSHFGKQYGGFLENWDSVCHETQLQCFDNISKGCSIIKQGHLYNYVHGSFICSSQNLETTYLSSAEEWIKKMIHWYDGVFITQFLKKMKSWNLQANG